MFLKILNYSKFSTVIAELIIDEAFPVLYFLIFEFNDNELNDKAITKYDRLSPIINSFMIGDHRSNF